jgi:hypothetical protein
MGMKKMDKDYSYENLGDQDRKRTDLLIAALFRHNPQKGALTEQLRVLKQESLARKLFRAREGHAG